MMKKFICSLMVSLLCALTAQADDNLYTINDLNVTLEDAQPVQAREKAVEKGTKDGFRRLLRTLTAQSTWQKHDDIIDQTALSKILDQYTVVQEKHGEPYTLTMNLRFNREEVRRILEEQKIPYSEVTAGPVLILPLFDMPSGQMLWEEMNPWRLTLEKEVPKSGLIHFVLPQQDATEALMLTPEMVAFGAGDMIKAVGDKYNAKMVVVARLRPKFNDSNTLAVDITWYGSHDIEPKTVEFENPSDKTFDMAMAAIAQQTLYNLEDDWRNVYVLEYDNQNAMLIRYDMPKLIGIERVEDILTSINVVDNVRLRSLSRQQAIFEVGYYGDVNRLKAMVADSDLVLDDSDIMLSVQFKRGAAASSQN